LDDERLSASAELPWRIEETAGAEPPSCGRNGPSRRQVPMLFDPVRHGRRFAWPRIGGLCGRGYSFQPRPRYREEPRSCGGFSWLSRSRDLGVRTNFGGADDMDADVRRFKTGRC
jgi:hypothetical protein